MWFFGVSALFGEGQRDAHHPVGVPRLAEADGIPPEVRNYGRPGVAMWQELELFQQLVASGSPTSSCSTTGSTTSPGR